MIFSFDALDNFFQNRVFTSLVFVLEKPDKFSTTDDEFEQNKKTSSQQQATRSQKATSSQDIITQVIFKKTCPKHPPNYYVISGFFVQPKIKNSTFEDVPRVLTLPSDSILGNRVIRDSMKREKLAFLC